MNKYWKWVRNKAPEGEDPDFAARTLFLNGTMTPLRSAGAAYQSGSGGSDPPEQDEPDEEPEEDTDNKKPHRRGRRNT